MPTDDTYGNIQEFATGGGGEGDDALSTSAIRDYVESELDKIGIFHSDDSDLPVGADARSGDFYSYDDLLSWWEGSGLVFFDEDGNTVQNVMVHIVRWEDEDTGETYYTVYIDEDSY